MTSDRTEATQGHLRTVSRNIVLASLSAVGALLVSGNAETWGEATVLGLGVVAAIVAVAAWKSARHSRTTLLCLAVAAAVWIFGVLVVDSPSASFGLSVAGTILVFQLPRHRRVAALVLVAFIASVVALRLVMSTEEAGLVLLEYAVGATSVAVVGVVLTSLNYVVSGLIEELAESREREAEMAVVRERVRFASDLHDIQGHTLHVVKLKVALARKLVHSDIDQVERELGEVHTLVGDTIAQTKELAYAQRRLNLPAELENAKNLFEAAGIRVHVDRGADVDTRGGELLGQVLRETTTNILRHAQAEQVWVTLTEAGITIVNDGVRDGAPPKLSGLATLRERVADGGGELSAEQKDGRFRTAARFPRQHSGTGLPAKEGTHEKDDR
ncbi:sensor histidine kinase [Nocardiopsis nanhaiensis]